VFGSALAPEGIFAFFLAVLLLRLGPAIAGSS
jgi:hypothetical protein